MYIVEMYYESYSMRPNFQKNQGSRIQHMSVKSVAGAVHGKELRFAICPPSGTDEPTYKSRPYTVLRNASF